MKFAILYISLSLIFSSAFGQKVKMIITKFHNSEQIKSQYSVLESDTTIKDGIFMKYIQTGGDSSLLRIKGQFIGNRKIGVWTWYSSNREVEKMYDYDSCKYLKGKYFVLKEVHYPEEAIINNIQGTVKVEYTVDCDCNIININILEGLGYGCDEEAIRNIKSSFNQIKNDGFPCDAETYTNNIIFKIE
jgi:TonB family protein